MTDPIRLTIQGDKIRFTLYGPLSEDRLILERALLARREAQLKEGAHGQQTKREYEG